MDVRILALLVLTGCFNRPVWFDSCECGDNLCVQDGAALECIAIPESCTVPFAGECDPNALDLDCATDVCGAFVGDWEFSIDCQARGGRVYRYADCTNVGTGTAPPGDTAVE